MRVCPPTAHKAAQAQDAVPAPYSGPSGTSRRQIKGHRDTATGGTRPADRAAPYLQNELLKLRLFLLDPFKSPLPLHLQNKDGSVTKHLAAPPRDVLAEPVCPNLNSGLEPTGMRDTWGFLQSQTSLRWGLLPTAGPDASSPGPTERRQVGRVAHHRLVGKHGARGSS